MQLAGDNVFGPPRDSAEAVRVLRAAIASGINHIDRAQYYGPATVKEVIREALSPYPGNLAIASKVAARRDEAGAVLAYDEPDQLRPDPPAPGREHPIWLGTDRRSGPLRTSTALSYRPRSLNAETIGRQRLHLRAAKSAIRARKPLRRRPKGSLETFLSWSPGQVGRSDLGPASRLQSAAAGGGAASLSTGTRYWRTAMDRVGSTLVKCLGSAASRPTALGCRYRCRPGRQWCSWLRWLGPRQG